MNFEDILYSTIEAYRGKYNLKVIQSADDEHIRKLIQEMEIHIERYKNTQHQLNEYQNNPEKYLEKPEGINYNHKVQLKAVNELILYLESMIKVAMIEIRERELSKLTAPAYQIAKLAVKINDNLIQLESLKEDKQPIKPDKTNDKSIKNALKVAPIKYKAKHFREVDTLRKTLKVVESIAKVAEKYGFSIDGFRQQYYNRWLPSKIKK
jgi:hypothetical protein